MIKLSRYLGLALAGIVLAGCTGDGAGGSTPEGAVVRYLEAAVAADTNQASALVCAAYEEAARLEVDSFRGTNATLESPVCTTGDPLPDGSRPVTCIGQINATYGNEVQTFSLADQTYVVVEEAGEWRMCGYR
jgi:hypothetical protein